AFSVRHSCRKRNLPAISAMQHRPRWNGHSGCKTGIAENDGCPGAAGGHFPQATLQPTTSSSSHVLQLYIQMRYEWDEGKNRLQPEKASGLIRNGGFGL